MFIEQCKFYAATVGDWSRIESLLFQTKKIDKRIVIEAERIVEGPCACSPHVNKFRTNSIDHKVHKYRVAYFEICSKIGSKSIGAVFVSVAVGTVIAAGLAIFPPPRAGSTVDTWAEDPLPPKFFVDDFGCSAANKIFLTPIIFPTIKNSKFQSCGKRSNNLEIKSRCHLQKNQDPMLEKIKMGGKSKDENLRNCQSKSPLSLKHNILNKLCVTTAKKTMTERRAAHEKFWVHLKYIRNQGKELTADVSLAFVSFSKEMASSDSLSRP
uniref:Uncharacterized protein n=1 Tax=Romanomermis culicivorax TaxID=13658 RepID=A0A915JD06_ROMCU